MLTHDNIHSLLGAAAHRFPDSPAILGVQRDPLTYRELLVRIQTTARELNAHGCGRGDCVAIVLPNGPEMAVCVLAVAAACISAPLNPSYSAAELEFYFSDLRPRAVIVEAGCESPAVAVARAHAIPVFRLHAGRLEGPAAVSAPAAGTEAEPEDVALALHTSGSTSRPKMVPLSQANLCCSARNIAGSLALSPADVCLNVMPLFHVHGLVCAVLSSLAAGASVVCTPGFSAPHFFEWLDGFRPTWYTAVPTMHQAVLARAARHSGTMTGLRLRFIRSCSSALPPKLMHGLEAAFSAPVIEAYGMTEASHQVAINPLPPRARKPGSVGLPTGCEAAIMDAAGALVAPGAPGEVVIRGAGVTRGYANHPEANRDAFIQGWFRTGDQGFLDAGGYLFLTGRSKEIINRGGEKISPREIDEVLLDHPAVAQVMAFSLPDEKLGEEVAAAVVLREDACAPAVELQEFAAARLADFKVPRQIVFLAELPKGPTGKPQRIGLAARLGLDVPAPAGPAGGDSIPPRTPVELRLAAIWGELLDAPPVSIDDTFFDLGGDSILGSQLIVRVRDAFGVELPMFRLFNAPALGALARWIESAPGAAAAELAPIPRASRAAPLPLSPAQHRMWFITQFEEEAPAYISPIALRMRGALDTPALHSALRSILHRHEVLRASYPNADGVPVLSVAGEWQLELPLVDLQNLAPAERESRVHQFAREQAFLPFDLSSTLPLRTHLLRLAPHEHVLLLTVHHIVFDGWSKSIFFRELSAFYEAALAHSRATLPELPIQYGDYAVWQRRMLAEEDGARLAEYWKERLRGMPTVLDLPSDRPRPARQSYRGGIERLLLAPSLADAVRALSRAESVTPFMTLLAAFLTVLFRYSGQTDIAVGSPIAGRARRETEDLIGLFVNVLVLRTQLGGDPSFRQLLARVRETTLGAYDHQQMPLERLLEIAPPERSLSHSPLFQVMFQLRNFPEVVYELEGLETETIPLDPGTSQFDLCLEVTETPAGLASMLTFNSDLYDAATARRMLSHYQTVLEAAVAAPDIALSRLPLLTEGERRRMLVEWNATSAACPPASVVKLFEEQVARTPSAVAAVHGRRSWSYADLNRQAGGFARRLRERGVRRGDLVAISVERSLEMIAALLGIWKAGAAYVPLDPAYPHERLAFILEDAAPAALITEPHLRGMFGELPMPVLDLAEVAPEEQMSEAGSPDDLAYLMYTSGSTGKPKGVAVRQGSLTNCLTFLQREIAVSPADVGLGLASISFDFSLADLFLPLISGARVALVGRDAAAEGGLLAREIADSGATILMATPVTWQILLEAGWSPVLGQKLLSAGERLPSPVAERLLAGGALWNFYGPTETTIVTTGWRVRDAAAASAIGRPIANTRVYVLDANGQPVPVGVPGELYVGGDGLARGYWGREDLTAERFLPDPFAQEPGARLYRTGDRVRFLADGNIDFLDRVDHQVKLRGYRIEPGEIESVLRQHPAVLAAVAGVIEPVPGDRRLAAWFVPRPGHAPDKTELRGLLKRTLPPYMYPAALVCLPSLPLTPSGKIDRKALSLPSFDSPEQLRRAPATTREILMIELWEDILGQRPIGLDDNFFDLGGHSLLGASILARIEKAFGVRVSFASLFLAPTPAQLLKLLEQSPGNIPTSQLIPLRRAGSGLPLVLVDMPPLFRPLILRLRDGRPVYALSEFDPATLSVPFQLEQIAARQVEGLDGLGKSGPLVLAGWCNYGVLAYEMARQLLAAGVHVPLVVLFDSYNPAAVQGRRWLWPGRLRYHVGQARRIDSRHVLPYGLERLRTLRGHLHTELWRARYRQRVRSGQNLAQSLRDPDQILNLAVSQYTTRPYPGPVLLFRPESRPTGQYADAAAGWRDLAPGLRIVHVPGNHVEMFREPNVAAMTAALESELSSLES